MQHNILIYWKVWVIILALQIVPAYAQTYMNAAGVETSTPNKITEIKPEKKEKAGANLESGNHAVFLEKTSQAVKGTSSSQKVMFSATKVSGKIQISFIVNGKEFLFVYESINFKQKKLNSIQLIPDSIEKNRKTKDDEVILTLLFKELEKDINQLDPLEGGILSSLDLLINMVPNDEPFDKIDLQGAKEKGLIQPQIFTNYICGNRGSSRTGTFDGDDGRVYTSKRIVGDPASECLGRCGKVCIQSAQILKRQYTDACFVHDLCTEHFDQKFGNCSDELVAAADDYLNALNCPFYVIGKWNLKYDWSYTGTASTAMVTHYSNHRFVASERGYVYGGVWELTSNKIIRTYDNGTKYTGTIEATNIKTKGTMVSFSGATGCFTDTYLTTGTKLFIKYNMENGQGSWSPQSPWLLTTSAAHSPTHSWTDSPGGNYGNNANVSLWSPSLNFSGLSSVMLTFWHRYALESNHDFGIVWITTDNGNTFKQMVSFTGINAKDGTQYTVDLSAFAGRSSVRIVFQLLSNGSITKDGWYIDDVLVTGR